MAFFFLCILFAAFPNEVLLGAKNGCRLCISTVVPSILPFLFAACCMIKSKFAKVIGIAASRLLSPISKMSSMGCVCFLGGLIGGYGSGVMMVQEAYLSKQISKQDAETILSYSNNAGPLFIVCAVGIGMLHSIKIGVELYLIQA